MRAVLLDAGGVLLHPDWSRVQGLVRPLGVVVDPAQLAHAELIVVRELDTESGVQTDNRRWIRFMRRVLELGEARGGDLDAAVSVLRQEHDRRNLWSRVPPEVPAALSALRSLGLRLGVVSNANGSVRKELRRVGLLPQFDVVVDSHEEGIEKPNPEIFRRALARIGQPSHETVFVGDVFHIDVVGARRAGLHPVLLDRAGLSADRGVSRISRLDELPVVLAEGLGTVAQLPSRP